MRNSVQLDQKHNEAIRSEIADRLGYLLPRNPSPLQTAMVNQIQEQEANVSHLQLMEQETTDPLAARLMRDIVSDMEAELTRQVNRLVAERH